MYSPYPSCIEVSALISIVRNVCLPGTIIILISALVELHTLSVEFLLHDEATASHLLNRLLNAPRGPLTEHGRKGMEELYCLVLDAERAGVSIN